MCSAKSLSLSPSLFLFRTGTRCRSNLQPRPPGIPNMSWGVNRKSATTADSPDQLLVCCVFSLSSLPPFPRPFLLLSVG